MMDGGMMGGGLMMLLVWLVLIALIVGGVWLLVRAVRGPGDRAGEGTVRGDGSSSALSILEERYARGEIDQREFEERRRTLRDQRD